MRFACPEDQVILFSITREEQIVVLLARPTANGPQGLELRKDSIDHHTAVRVAQKYCPRGPVTVKRSQFLL